MMMTFITQGGEGRGKTNKKRKATKSEGRGLEEGARRALMRQVGEEGCGVSLYLFFKKKHLQLMVAGPFPL